MNFTQLRDITQGHVLVHSEEGEITTLLTDSRKAVASKGAVFFAISGARHDGHAYIEKLYDIGIRQFVVEKPIDIHRLSGSNVLLVNSAIDAIQRIAAHKRQQSKAQVIGITGSNGKTIIKEWLYQLLSPDFKTVKNPGSYNSQLGVPLSVWHLEPDHTLGIFEAGISRAGEMSRLEQIIQPTIGLMTNIGSAHDEGFVSREQKVLEKMKLFEHATVVIYRADDPMIERIAKTLQLPSLTWATTKEADITITAKNSKTYQIKYNGIEQEINIAAGDEASKENMFHCVAIMLKLGYGIPDIEKRLALLRAVPMRLELKEGINQCQIIDDTYNNDIGGLQISLDFLLNQSQKKTKRLILSDILESGLEPGTLTNQLAKIINSSSIQQFIGIGEMLSDAQEKFTKPSRFFKNTASFIQEFDFSELKDEVILVKGARVFEFEKIVSKLQRKVHGTVMEIDLGAVIHNLNFFKSLLKPETKIMVMVKAFAYGSGSTEIANLLQFHKVNYLGVAYADEGIDLRKNNIQLPIMVMNPSEESFDALLENDLEPEIYSFKILHDYIRFLDGRASTIHLKLDTGMHRLGFEAKEIELLCRTLSNYTNIRVASIFSHLAGADESKHDTFSKQQADTFRTMGDSISSTLQYRPIYHLLNSPGILRLPQFQFDMVRLGIGLYGIDPTDGQINTLRPVATLKTIISQIKHIPKGETIGYGRRGNAEQDMTLATIAIGYADGFSRALSRGVGAVMVNGQMAKVVGNVCMDMTMIDITGIAASEGDPVIIFGKELPIQQVAAAINTIPYEILTSTSERVKRVFIAESM